MSHCPLAPVVHFPTDFVSSAPFGGPPPTGAASTNSSNVAPATGFPFESDFVMWTVRPFAPAGRVIIEMTRMAAMPRLAVRAALRMGATVPAVRGRRKDFDNGPVRGPDVSVFEPTIRSTRP